MKIVLFITTGVYFFLTFVLPTYRVWKRTGIMPIVFPKEDDAHSFIGKIFKTIITLLFINVIIYSFLDKWYAYLNPMEIFNNWPFISYVGIGLVFISLMIVVAAQTQMANSWRIGIDFDNKTKLVTDGIFGHSRNPIFLGIQIALLGLFLLTPNVLMLLVFVIGVFCIQIQVRLEEAFLSAQHSNEYLTYKNKVRRWL